MKVCIIVAKNYLPFARVLADSYAAHHDGDRISVLLFDDPAGDVSAGSEPFHIIRPSELGLSRRGFHTMAAIYNAQELAAALKPWLLGHLMDEDAETVLFLHPDIG